MTVEQAPPPPGLIYILGWWREVSTAPLMSAVVLTARPRAQTRVAHIADDAGNVMYGVGVSAATDPEGRALLTLVWVEGAVYDVEFGGVKGTLRCDDWDEGSTVPFTGIRGLPGGDGIADPLTWDAVISGLNGRIAAEVAEQLADPGSAMSLAIAAAAGASAIAAQDAATAAQTALLTPGALPARFTNLITDPTYQTFGAAGWHFLGGTAVRSGNDAVVTATGTLGGVGLYSSAGQAFTGHAGHRYYVRAEMTVENDSPASPSYLSVSLSDNTTHVYVTGAVAAISSPAKGTRYTISGIVELPADYEGNGIRLYQRAFFPSPAAANGAKVRLHPDVVFDLTAASPTMPEPSLTTLDREIATASAVAPVTNHTRAATTILGQTFAARVKKSVAAGPHVVLRFDDGYVNNVEVAAPIMARYGYPGTLFTGTHPTEWLGGSHAGQPLMTPAQLLELHHRYGWEIGSHTRHHDDAIATPLADWVTNIEASIVDLVGYGLPRPRSFAYPNGSRTPTTDRFVYSLFDKCGITGGPERTPWPYNAGTFFTGWSAIGGATDAEADAAIEKAQAYVRASFEQGRIPILGFHGVTVEQPSLGYFLRSDKFASLMQWLWEQGYPVSTMSDTPDHNLIADPGFEINPVRTWAAGSHPWGVNSDTGGWTRTNAVPVLGSYAMSLNAPSGVASMQWFEQRIAVEPAREYRVYVRHSSPTITAGSIRTAVYFHDVLGNQSTSATVLTISASVPSSSLVTGTFTVPAGSHVARLNIQSDPSLGFTGDARVEYVACYPTDTYDPLA